MYYRRTASIIPPIIVLFVMVVSFHLETLRPQTDQELDSDKRTIEFTCDNKHYRAIASVYPPFTLRIFNTDETARQIFKYSEYRYTYTADLDDFKVVNILNDGGRQAVWKYCKGHDCPNRSTVIAFDIRNASFFRLDWSWKEEKKIITLSNNLADPKNIAIRKWLLSWWEEWPGYKDPDSAWIIYDAAK